MSHKIVRMLLAVMAILSIIFVLTGGYFPSVNNHLDVFFLTAFIFLFFKRFRSIIGQGFLHLANAFFKFA